MGDPPPYELGKTLGKMEGHLDSIDQKLEEGAETMKEICAETRELKKRDDDVVKWLERHNNRLHTQETEMKNVRISAKKIDSHVDNKDIHFDKQLASTTKFAYLMKKKFLAAILGLFTVIITLVTTYLLTAYGGI
jgi:chromosome segregation ATPase